MTERPILFSGPMVCAILDGRKTQTRRVIAKMPATLPGWWKALHWASAGHFIKGAAEHCPYGQPGDRLWVRETFAILDEGGGTKATHYRADAGGDTRIDRASGERWRPAIHMPRRACRLVLEIVSVRVERLQEISAKDILAEGAVDRPHHDEHFGKCPVSAFDGKAYLDLKTLWAAGWDSINAKRAPWSSNPWVWVVEFRPTSTRTTVE